ncbi:MAG: hypothetical protein J6Y87_08185 [Muribaculaceae bacterium]|nr:hypothetical protein [Muribaculaceae bacterium]
MSSEENDKKSFSTGKCLPYVKQFLLSLLATTISIILTFGTTTWREHQKKDNARHEMVMMLLYDISNSIKLVQESDSTLRAGYEQQLKIAENPELLTANPFIFTKFCPSLEYAETIENIFSSNIETINVIGNVLFAENISDIYLMRKKYRKEVVDSFMEEFKNNKGYSGYEQIIELNYPTYIYLSGSILCQMKEKLDECKRMMDVSDDELESYRQNRISLSNSSKTDSIDNALLQEMMLNIDKFNEAKEKAKTQ